MTALNLKKAAVVGLGKSGKSATALLRARGVDVVGFDEKGDGGLTGIEVRVGPLTERFWQGFDAVIVSPGVPLSKPELVAARAAGALVMGEIELAYRMLPPNAGPILGVTGTNGKSTTTALLGELMQKTGKRVFVGGNLGRPFTEAALEPYDWHVVELSSFQLEGIQSASFFGAAILNLQPDHLDRYESHHAYGQAKARIFMNTPRDGFAVVNADDPAVVELARAYGVPKYGFTLDPRRSNASFKGLAAGTGSRFSLVFAGGGMFEVNNRALRGAHNLQNAMAAAIMAARAGVSPELIQAGLDSFPGLPHRLESVRELHGVEWVNDSKATNVDSSLVALKALSGRIWLIAGGKGKGAPYQPMVDAARGKVLGVLTIGQDAPAIGNAFSGFDVMPCQTLEAAVASAKSKAKPGDTVLLSPACASYDQFDNFEHRGDTFKRLVRALT